MPAVAFSSRLTIEPEAHFAVRVIPEEAVHQQEAVEDEQDELLQAVRLLQPMPSTEDREQVERCLNWRYDMHGLDHVPAKLTVTEIKHRFAEFERLAQDAPSEQLLEPLNRPADPADPAQGLTQAGSRGLRQAQPERVLALHHLSLSGSGRCTRSG